MVMVYAVFRKFRQAPPQLCVESTEDGPDAAFTHLPEVQQHRANDKDMVLLPRSAR